MLEVCPSIAAAKPRIEVHPLGIGGKESPARLVFEGHPGKAIVISLIDMGGTAAPHRSGYRMCQADHGYAEPAGCPRDVEDQTKPA